MADSLIDGLTITKKDDNGQTEYGRALANGYSAVTFDESKAFSYTNGLLAPGEILTTVTLNTDGTGTVSNHTVTLFEWSNLLLLTSSFDQSQREQGKPTSGAPLKLLSDFVSSIVGTETNISVNLPNVPGPATGAGSTDKLSKKDDDLISGSLKRSPSYRSELAQKTYREIRDLAKQGGAEGKAARGMKKLIEQAERLREKGKGK